MRHWWYHHEGKVPMIEDDDKARVEDLTGRIPLLLCPLLEFTGKQFCDIEHEFLEHRDLAVIEKNIRESAAVKIKTETGSNYEKWVITCFL